MAKQQQNQTLLLGSTASSQSIHKSFESPPPLKRTGYKTKWSDLAGFCLFIIEHIKLCQNFIKNPLIKKLPPAIPFFCIWGSSSPLFSNNPPPPIKILLTPNLQCGYFKDYYSGLGGEWGDYDGVDRQPYFMVHIPQSFSFGPDFFLKNTSKIK